MGLLRFILALAVMISHARGIRLEGMSPYFITGAKVAVQCFYIISGFYMALILNDKYTNQKGGIYLFYTNRIWRLMPVYLLFLFASFCLSLLCLEFDFFPQQPTTSFITSFNQFDLTTLVCIIFTNIFVIGHDLASLFLGMNPSDGSLFFNLDINKPEGLGKFYFILQSWTLSLELYFYMIIPLIIKRTRFIISLVVLSFITRIVLYSMGYNFHFWEYAIFPNELALFLLGSLSYKLYTIIKDKNNFNLLTAKIISLIIFLLTFCYPLLPQGRILAYFFDNSQLIYYTAIVVGLPFLFHISNKNKIDRFIGELSYPIYLAHLMIIPFWFSILTPDRSVLTISLISLSTIAVSLAAVFFIQKPVDKFRQGRYEEAISLSHHGS